MAANRFAWFGTAEGFRHADADLPPYADRRFQRASLPLRAGPQHLHRRGRRGDLRPRRLRAHGRGRHRAALCEKVFADALGGKHAGVQQFDLAAVSASEQRALAPRQACADRRRRPHRAFLHRLRHAARDGGRHRARQGAGRARRRCGGRAAGVRSGAPADRGQNRHRRRRQRGLVREFRRAHGALAGRISP